jgi:hypothetical protein
MKIFILKNNIVSKKLLNLRLEELSEINYQYDKKNGKCIGYFENGQK